MKKLLVIPFLLISSYVYSQVSPTDKFALNQDASTLSIVQAYRYELEIDKVIQTNPLVTTCTGSATPFTCLAPIPAITPASHTVRFRAVDISGSAPLVGEWSDPFTFVMKALPTKPTSIRIIPGN